MNRLRASNVPDSELLLLLFTTGALLGMLYRNRMAEFLKLIPGSTVGCFAALLAFDASMTGSLFAWLTFPLITLLFGAAAAAEAFGILSAGMSAARDRLILLALITPLHFLLSVWNMQTAGRMYRALKARGVEGRAAIISFLLMGMAFLVCFTLIKLELQARL